MKSEYTTSDKLAIALACLAGALAIVLFLVEKTRFVIAAMLVLMFLLCVYPIFHFLPSSRLRGLSLALLLVGTSTFGWSVWPERPTANIAAKTNDDHAIAARSLTATENGGASPQNATQVPLSSSGETESHRTAESAAVPQRHGTTENANPIVKKETHTKTALPRQAEPKEQKSQSKFAQNIFGSHNIGIQAEQLNIGTGGRVISTDNFEKLVSALKQLPAGTATLVVFEPVTSEMEAFGGQLQSAFRRAGKSLPGYRRDVSRDFVTVLDDNGVHKNTPDGLHCATDGSQIADQITVALGRSGIECTKASAALYPPPDPTVSVTIFMGRLH